MALNWDLIFSKVPCPGTSELFEPARWGMVVPALSEWARFLVLHNIGAVTFDQANVLQQQECDCRPKNVGIRRKI